VSFAAIILRIASQRVFDVVSVYFVIDSVRKLMDTPSYVLDRRLGWPMSISGRDGEDHIRGSARNQSSVAKSVTSYFTD
jgi:hypothetical protein